MDVITALDHPWLTRRLMIDQDEFMITTDRLRNSYRSWQSNAQCRTWYRRRPLSGAYTDPSKMVYPPGHVYTPEDTPERIDIGKKDRKPGKWDNEIPTREHPDYEIGLFKSESHYQNGPDTYLLQLRDVDFPVRLREYMKVAATRSPGYSHTLTDLSNYDWRTPVIHERRRFHDIMDEEIDDERKERINRYGSADVYSLRRLRNELGTRLDSYAEAEAMIESQKVGKAPFFREKPRNIAIVAGRDAELSCLATGDPKPTLQWFKNESVLMENKRITVTEDEQVFKTLALRSTLRFTPAAEFDAGSYKVVARNSVGQTIHRIRVALGTQPDAPNTPKCIEKSDTEVLLEWREPRHDGNSEILHYGLEMKKADSIDWNSVAEHITRERFVVTGLAAGESYHFAME
ncbi:obscurin-like [Ctenocephalides felis]|uniref:obscurin-like n=1 Tax=Ctenocephalides felis TaxID=7515 RepID=UPI000E6E5977|nr:obscurin-like [Ctenocephalides felis]